MSAALALYGLSQEGPQGPFGEYKVMSQQIAENYNHHDKLWEWYPIATLSECMAARDMAEALSPLISTALAFTDETHNNVKRARAALQKAGHA